jgi:hydrogenase expression/formation protein HypC
MAKVDFGGTYKEVSAALVPDLAVGDYTIVHVGFALERIDERVALESLAMFESLSEQLPWSG